MNKSEKRKKERWGEYLYTYLKDDPRNRVEYLVRKIRSFF